MLSSEFSTSTEATEAKKPLWKFKKAPQSGRFSYTALVKYFMCIDRREVFMYISDNYALYNEYVQNGCITSQICHAIFGAFFPFISSALFLTPLDQRMSLFQYIERKQCV